MIKASKICASLAAFALSASALAAFSPSAFAANEGNDPVTSSRSFRKVNTVRKDLLKESTSTSVDAKSDWGGIESLDVPQTQSQAEKDAAAAKARADQAAAASRSAARDSLSAPQNFTVTPPNGQSVSSLLTFANQFIGKVPYVSGGTSPAGWDCSGFVQYVFAQIGVALPRTSGAQATAGRPVADLSQAMPGDIIANAGHAAIYVGNGMVVNAQLNGTQYDSVPVVFSGGYSIRRVL
ncbi:MULTISPECIES: C40 family peptidase [unclassified Bifidobacterium]|uniref:C40 family peptidase n=1 Tax=unclassified Bifidobacterium TaxID=2608897 RepID=UPI0023F6549B|nr:MULTISPECIES: C40 family peptidase [unclassified Bifidobacterium]WEV65395.1 C40 family peptidase [Bifidobacterium sp. ESL0764]WEV75806.1 C40 family peptidase [Bifidobacterium sp. ESL0800]